MGRVGTGAYDASSSDLHKNVCGIDVDQNCVLGHRQCGRKVTAADSADPDFWDHIDLGNIELVMLTTPSHEDIVEAARQLKRVRYAGKIAAIAHYPDEEPSLLESGVDVVFNYYQNAGAGLAERSLHLFDRELHPEQVLHPESASRESPGEE